MVYSKPHAFRGTIKIVCAASLQLEKAAQMQKLLEDDIAHHHAVLMG